MKAKCLYKYRDWSDRYHKRMLRDSEIYFASPTEFNDPFDCKIQNDFRNLTEPERLQHAKDRLRLANPRMDDKLLDSQAKELSRDGMLEQVDGSQGMKTFMNLFGLFSLSVLRDNILMWSHYTKMHTGFCVGFDTNKLEAYLRDYVISNRHSMVRLDMSYRTDRRMLDPYVKADDSQQSRVLESIFQIKSIGWAYEEEERLLIYTSDENVGLRPNNRTVTLNAGIVTEVILGCRMGDKDKEEIRKIVRVKHPDAKLYHAIPKEYEFGLDINLIVD